MWGKLLTTWVGGCVEGNDRATHRMPFLLASLHNRRGHNVESEGVRDTEKKENRNESKATCSTEIIKKQKKRNNRHMWKGGDVEENSYRERRPWMNYKKLTLHVQWKPLTNEHCLVRATWKGAQTLTTMYAYSCQNLPGVAHTHTHHFGWGVKGENPGMKKRQRW